MVPVIGRVLRPLYQFRRHTEQGIITHVSGEQHSLIPALQITCPGGIPDLGSFFTSTICPL
jgi:hypothetical protein